MKRPLLLVLLLLVPALPAPAQAPAPAPAPASVPAASLAATAALSWLDLIDQGRYADSLGPVCSYVKKGFSRDKWAGILVANRGSVKTLRSRKIASSVYASSLPDAPRGEYVVVTFHSAFSEKPQAVETVTCMRDADGQWRVAGYYIR